MAEKGDIDWSLLPDDLRPDMREILEKCLALSPENRFDTSSDLAKSLEYIIYKDGYGPTIQTLETYLRRQMPYLYHNNKTMISGQPTKTTRVSSPITATLILDQRPEKGDG